MGIALASDTSGVTAGKFVVKYNASLFDFVSATAAQAGTQIVDTNEALGQVTIVTAALGTALAPQAPIIKLTFTSKASAGVNDFEVSAELGLGSNGALQSASPQKLGIASQETALGVTGDLNGNNAVDVGDLSILVAHYGAKSTDAGWSLVSAADFNSDGTIDIADLAALGKIIVYDAGSSFDIMETDIMDIQNAMAAGKLTAVELVSAYLKRIAEYDKQGPSINAVISVNPDALAIAAQLDAERGQSGPRSLLHGVPVIVKDNYNTIGMATTAGCTCLKNNFTTTDAKMVAQLKAAGAIIIGKANLHEFAFGLTTISSLGGQTLNPYDLTKNPGGSSGGTGAALAANFAVLGLGTDTGGSIRVPSSYNSLVGLRPTIGLTSREGIVPLALSQDVGGPMARSVEDIAVALDFLKGYDAADPATLYSVGRTPTTYTKYLDKNGLKGARIGVIRDPLVMGTNQSVIALANKAVEDMQAAGATVIDVVVPNLSSILSYSSLSGYEFKSDLNTYFNTYINSNPSSQVPYHSLSDIIDSGTDMLVSARNSYITRNNVADLATNQDYRDIIINRPKLAQQALLKTMNENNLDALLYPSTANPPTSLTGTNAGSANRLSPYSGFPAIGIPAGFVDNGAQPKLPQNIELLGRPFDEGTLIKLAYSFEQLTHHREAPPYDAGNSRSVHAAAGRLTPTMNLDHAAGSL
ncbi:amidase family protein [Cohnella rhizosphaerae]|uniref:Amidase family protein n=1 Tax=Cohnella rhizosphaerae TaxID=1457232 RepID=A0A9X4QTN3_9BACL|nr:amidase family protein [Cohnella rhizosphaerae]MDG0810553.1 amidase family protein [Cohnella rhizosphaerae]